MTPSASQSPLGGVIPNDPSTDAQQQNNENTRGRVNDPSPDDVPILEQLAGTRKKLRIAILGAGLSGLNFMKRAEEQLKNVELVCYEKNADVGGTWYENRYPGCACDIPSVVYQFPWRPRPWSAYYSTSPEIWAYIKDTERENNFIEKYIKLEHKTTGVSWSDDSAQWTISLQDLRTGREFDDYADLILDGCGVLNKWKWPDIPGLHDFKGDLLHSAQWNQNVSLKGKRVALIGAGSSAVQILPNIYAASDHIYHWVRNKIWITAGFAQAFAGPNGANFKYNDDQLELFRTQPDAYLTYRKMIEAELNQRFSFIINGSKAQNDARDFSENEMRTLLRERPELVDKIMQVACHHPTPSNRLTLLPRPTDFFVGCRRPTPGNGYLEALSSPKVTVYDTQLTRITPTGFTSPSGDPIPVDTIICATGFDTTYKPRHPFLVNNVDMRDKWSSHPHVPTYLSLAFGGVPNYFTFAGAYCPSAHGSFFPLIEGWTSYFIQIIQKVQVENIRSVTPKQHVADAFVRHADTFLKRTAWTGNCSSWFKGGKANGRPAIWPGSRLHFLRAVESVRWEDYEIVYEDEENMWAWLGNGFHVCERDGSDITWYLGKSEGEVDKERVREVMKGEKGVVMKRPGS